MPVEKVKIEFSEGDLRDMIAEKYNLRLDQFSLIVNYWAGDQREPERLSITIEAFKRDKSQ